ncbi:uncharacterized protein C10orf82 homolog [Monodelphis domestica]|uniref:Sperm-associated microtubule inner protein 5 domain-containing protein n=1 Tax=Monodelphis domestica TaxID=13616 RepID=F7F9K7_MONDO|nr:uncharacterized protein C10orf82 homolog [Monodelphis domestica]
MDKPEVFMRKLPITPGYSGYLPLRFSRMGASFNKDATYCLHTLNNMTQRQKDQQDALRCKALMTERLQQVCSKETVLRMIHDYYLRHHPSQIEDRHGRKPLPEPPIPGWDGYLPRARVTELGCGERYNVVAKKSYADFLNISETHKRGPFKRYQSIFGDQPLKTAPIIPEFCQKVHLNRPNEDTNIKPTEESPPSLPCRISPKPYHGPCGFRKYLDPLPYTGSAGGNLSVLGTCQCKPSFH